MQALHLAKNNNNEKNRWNKKLSFRRNLMIDLMSKKHKKMSRALNCFEYFLSFLLSVVVFPPLYLLYWLVFS